MTDPSARVSVSPCAVFWRVLSARPSGVYRPIRRWIANEPVKDKYDAETTASLFRWRDQGLTLPEAAAIFSTPDEWDAGETSLFDSESKDALGFYLKQPDPNSSAYTQIKPIIDAFGIRGWAHVPAAGRRSVIAATVWLVLLEEQIPKPVFSIRGFQFDTARLLLMARAAHGPLDLSVLRALVSDEFISLLSFHDPGSSRIFGQVASSRAALLRRRSGQEIKLRLEMPKRALVLSEMVLEPETSS